MDIIRKAIIPAAGFGTRFLPETKAMPKKFWLAGFRRFLLFPVMQNGPLKIILILLRSWNSTYWNPES